MKYRFEITVFSHDTPLFSTAINGDSIQEVAAYYLGRDHITERLSGREIRERMTRIEFHEQILN